MIDHIHLRVTNLPNAMIFYEHALAPLGYGILRKDAQYCAIGPTSVEKKWQGTIWLEESSSSDAIHIALRTHSRKIVDEFYEAGRAHGGTFNGKPGIRTHYHPHYYAAFLLDPDGNNVEVVSHIEE